MDLNLICSLFEGLPRQGPGDFEHTQKAFKMLSGVSKCAKILDIGCGKGVQTIALAKLCPDCLITAVDIYQPFLDTLNENAAEEEGLSKRIKTVCASMDDLSFDEGEFDIIWAEGSIFIIGFEKGINYWKKFLRPGGQMVVSDAAWFIDKPSKEPFDFWMECYPGIKTEAEVLKIIKDAGLKTAGTFRLSDEVWYESYYNYMKINNETLRQKYKENEEVIEIIEFNDKEMDIFARYSKEYGYTYFLIQKS